MFELWTCFWQMTSQSCGCRCSSSVCVSGSYLASGSWNSSRNRANAWMLNGWGGEQEEIHTSGMSLLLFATGNILCTGFFSLFLVPLARFSTVSDSEEQMGLDRVWRHTWFSSTERLRDSMRKQTWKRQRQKSNASWSLSIWVYIHCQDLCRVRDQWHLYISVYLHIYSFWSCTKNWKMLHLNTFESCTTLRCLY